MKGDIDMKIINLGNKVINIYLIKISNGYLLIDTGYSEHFKGFCHKLKKHSIDIKEIKYIFLTHAHDDHAGFLNEILEVTDAKIILHPLAIERIKSGQNSFKGGCTSRLAHTFCMILKLLGKGEHRFPPVDQLNRYLVLNETSKEVIEKEIEASIIYLPGHTKDSIGLVFNDGSLFCGDAAMNGFPSKHYITIWAEDLIDFRNSWNLIIDLNPRKIYPSHGKHFKVGKIISNIQNLSNIKLIPLK